MRCVICASTWVKQTSGSDGQIALLKAVCMVGNFPAESVHAHYSQYHVKLSLPVLSCHRSCFQARSVHNGMRRWFCTFVHSFTIAINHSNPLYTAVVCNTCSHHGLIGGTCVHLNLTQSFVLLYFNLCTCIQLYKEKQIQKIGTIYQSHAYKKGK